MVGEEAHTDGYRDLNSWLMERQICWSQHLTDGADGGDEAGLTEQLQWRNNTHRS